MNPALVDPPTRRTSPAKGTRFFSLMASDMRALRVREARRPRMPVRKPPRMTSYRIFTTIMFVCVALINEWTDRSVAPFIGPDVVGPTSVILSALTLVGSFGIGPVAGIWDAMRR